MSNTENKSATPAGANMDGIPRGLIPPHIENPQAFLDEVLRRDFPTFLKKAFATLNGGQEIAWNWHLEAIAFMLDRVQHGHNQRLLVTMPPRNLKSIAISVAWVAWMLGQDPTLRFLCVSYSSELASKLARMCRSLMETDWYRRIFAQTRISGRSAAHDFDTTRGGGRLATSMTGTVTGRGAGIMIIDDPIKPDEAMSDVVREATNHSYRSTLSSRLDDKKTNAIITVMQRLHEEDLAGIMIEEGGWDHLNLPAIATEDQTIRLTRGRVHQRRIGDVLHPAREPLVVLENLKRQQGSHIFSAQYQQQPVPATGNMVEVQWLKYYDAPLERLPGDQIVQSWDTASKDGIHNDFSVCITALMRGQDVYLLEVYRAKLKFPDLLRRAIELARQYGPLTALILEDAASGIALQQQLINDGPAGVPHPSVRRPKTDKVTRLSGVSAMIENNLRIPRGAAWRADFEIELLGFPNKKHDDQVDALSQLLEWVGQQNRYTPSHGMPILVDHENPDGNIWGDVDDADDAGDDYLESLFN